MLKKILVLAMIAVLFTVNVKAADEDITTTPPYLRKLVRGAVNLAFCWLALPQQMAVASEETDSETTGFIIGFSRGATRMVQRAFIGAYEVSSFIIKPYDSALKPEFIFDEGLNSEFNFDNDSIDKEE